MLEQGITLLAVVILVSIYQALRGGIDYLNSERESKNLPQKSIPLWLNAFMLVSYTLLFLSVTYVWITQVWLVALAMTVATFMASVSVKMIFLPRSESDFYQKYFEGPLTGTKELS
ncbi:hypothetical protein [Pleionea sp. CnH1-48]|uniref:hypothetical protein n=1 Tax=Pleionea sp. CnH1-48 TaxID=2954494 RepID=UPI002098341E|nr:hypothetical protein [Pleionea sp. CnH1-48]MCO7226344.1 hypothetical protein [Pleionea sp. CnH1-48]